MNKIKILIPALLLIIGGLVFFNISYVYAQNTQENYPSIIQKLVEKFGLKESDVKAVFDQDRQERQAQMQAKFEEKLNQAVKDGKLTEDQKQLILAKHKELQARRATKPENWQNMTREQRQEFNQAQRKELEDWAKQNNIDLQYFFGDNKMRGHGCFK